MFLYNLPDDVFVCTCYNTQSNSCSFFCSSYYRPDTNRINGYGFFQKCMFIICYSLKKMFWTEMWWCSQNNNIHFGKCHQFFIPVKSYKTVFCRNRQFEGCKSLAACINFILKYIGTVSYTHLTLPTI